MTILITGAAGYIGSHFVRRFLKTRQEKILAIDNLSGGYRPAIPDDEKLVFHQIEIADSTQLNELIRTHEVTALVHFASSILVGESEQQPLRYFKNNVSNTLSLFDSVLSNGIKHVVFSSSCAVYGDPLFMPLTEDHPRNPISIYGQTKLMAEQVLESLHRTLDLSFVSLRYFNAAGADESGEIGEAHVPETHLIPNVLRVLTGQLECLQIYGDDFDTPDGTCIRDYIHVNDLADAHIAALDLLRTSKRKLDEHINLGTGAGYSVKEIVDKCQEISGKKVKSLIKPRRAGDPPRLIANYAKAQALLSWQPRYELETILQTAWNWELNRRY
ncbi:MAG: UDP-glucose 4-epimerase GalE [Candidatus Obscuribacterales bacterium]|jgi:UDP-glucose 4-epimerase|nr:UDP-glucose 4-epimerase GalE [Candidatus Obscuribacterales bacterium]